MKNVAVEEMSKSLDDSYDSDDNKPSSRVVMSDPPVPLVLAEVPILVFAMTP